MDLAVASKVRDDGKVSAASFHFARKSSFWCESRCLQGASVRTRVTYAFRQYGCTCVFGASSVG